MVYLPSKSRLYLDNDGDGEGDGDEVVQLNSRHDKVTLEEPKPQVLVHSRGLENILREVHELVEIFQLSDLQKF
jgi:hypothetical protein